MSMTVWEWFEQRSYHHRDFEGLGRSRGQRGGATLHDPDLPGPQRRRHHRRHPLRRRRTCGARTGLPDQVIVIDADSPDGTADIARAHGAEVYSENELMPDYGPAQGKGDAMWRALSVARGDIVMFADADTADFEEHFVYGTLGPLLADPAAPVRQGRLPAAVQAGEEKIPDGGGRVTELMAKPLINLFYPELAGFVQPLAGEFAGRRERAQQRPVLHRLRRGDRHADRRVRPGRPGRPWPRSTSAPGRTGTSRSPASAGCPRSCCAPWPRARAWRSVSTGTSTGTCPACGTRQPDTYLHAVATEDGLRLDEHLNELVERPAARQPDRRHRPEHHR